jgi:TolA-binding protein
MALHNDSQGWHLDKRVPIAIITAIAVQTFGIVWWAATLSARVDVNTRDFDRVSSELIVLRELVHQQNVRHARLEEQITGMRADIDRLIHSIREQRQ